MRFVGRDIELAALTAELERAQSGDGGRLVWLRGRRRVGKSRLVQEFCDRARVPYCFFQAPARGRDEAIAEFADAAVASGVANLEGVSGFRTWTAALAAATQQASVERPIVLVLDELPYLVEHDEGFAADLQRAWDRELSHRPVVVVAIGSDVRMMETLVAARSPLHGRPTRELSVGPLDPRAVAEITGAPSPADAFDRYLIVGGFPQIAGSWEPGQDVAAFLAAALADDQSPFVTGAERALAAEFATNLSARRVLTAIGAGEVAYGHLADRSGVARNTLSDALTVLINKGVARRDLPYAAPPAKKPARYTVADPHLRFWLRFVAPQLDVLARGRGDLAVSQLLERWPSYRGHAIEPLVRDCLERLLLEPSLASSLGGARHIGAFWDRTGTIEVDIVGGDQPDPASIGLVGSIKWREDAPFEAADAEALATHRARIPGAAAAALVAVTRTSAAPRVKLDAVFTPEDLLEAW